MELVVLVILLALIPAAVASNKGYPFLIWWIYGVVLLPLAFIHALLIEHVDRSRVCPFCAEKIMVQALVCPHCQRDLPERRAHPGATSVDVAIAEIADMPTDLARKTDAGKVLRGPLILLVVGSLAIMAYVIALRAG